MIPLLIVFTLFDLTQQNSYIPASALPSLTECRLEFETTVRELYPEYQIITGEQFIAQFDSSSCSILSKQTHTESSCNGVTGPCLDEATSVIRLDDTTLNYCYTNNKSPKPMTATLLPNGTYGYSDGGLGVACLYDASKQSFLTIDSTDQMLYVATDAKLQDDPWLHYYSIPDNKQRDRMEVSGYVDSVIGMFSRGDFLYTMYTDNQKKNKITRSCLKEKSNENELVTYTYTDISCTDTIGGQQVVLDRTLAMEYNPTQDKLYVLLTQDPISSSAVYVCVFDVDQDVNHVFDTTQYYIRDESGDLVKSNQGKVDCSKSRSNPVASQSVDPVVSTEVILRTQSTDIFSFSSHLTGGDLLFYLLSPSSVYVYDTKTSNGRLLGELVLDTPAKNMVITRDTIYLTSGNAVTMVPTYWCSHYGQDPVSCIAAMHPACSYSKQQSKCLHTELCTDEDECVQDLDNGSFPTLFPDGYTVLVEGSVCIHDLFFADTTYTYFPNSTHVTTTSFRECVDRPVTTAPVITTNSRLSSREMAFLIGMVIAVAVALAGCMVLLIRAKPKLCHVYPSSTNETMKCDTGKSSPSHGKNATQTKPTVTSLIENHMSPSHVQVDICKSLDVRCTPNSNTVKYNSSGDKRAIVDPGTPISTAGITPVGIDPLSGFNPVVDANEAGIMEHSVVMRNRSAGAIELPDV